MIRIRNKQTGEIRDVDENSEEWADLRLEVKPDGNSKWEQVAEHQHRAISQRAEEDALRPEDLGDEDQERYNNAPTVPFATGPDPNRELTEGEREAGLKSWEEKEKQLKQVTGEKTDHLQAVLSDASEKIAPRRRRGGSKSAGGTTTLSAKDVKSGGLGSGGGGEE